MAYFVKKRENFHIFLKFFLGKFGGFPRCSYLCIRFSGLAPRFASTRSVL